MRREVAWIGLSTGLLFALVVAAYGCGQTSSGSCADNGTCAAMDAGADQTAPSIESGAEAEAAVDAGADAADAGDGFDGYVCDPTKTPAQDPCVITSTDGIFVSPTGRNGAMGTMGDPFLLVGDAIAAATGHSDRVLACAGTYDESLILGSSPGQDAGTAGVQDGASEAAQEEASFTGGVTVFGGLDCANGWKYTGAKAVLAPTTRGTALTVKGLMVGLTFEDFGFHSVAATQPGESSIAVFASNSPAPGLVLIRCDIEAGAGQPGTDQVGVVGFDGGALTGQAGTATNGGGTASNSCGGVAMASTGGAGGPPAPAPGADGQDGTPEPSANPSNKGTAAACSASNTGGGSGANGAAGTSGPGAASWAQFDGNGWVPSDGEAGAAGGDGQGGGGGGSVNNGGGGGGGGAGGCGGVGGTAGAGGGSSVGLLVFQSNVDLEQSSIGVGSAGRGGSGASGQAGQGGGAGNNGFADTLGIHGCPGGKGGAGGNGGGGGGGAGGLSVGVLWSGTAPTIDGSPIGQALVVDAGGDAGTVAQIVVGSAGVGGTGGGSGTDAGSNAGTNGKSGTSAAVMQFQ